MTCCTVDWIGSYTVDFFYVCPYAKISIFVMVM